MSCFHNHDATLNRAANGDRAEPATCCMWRVCSSSVVVVILFALSLAMCFLEHEQGVRSLSTTTLGVDVLGNLHMQKASQQRQARSPALKLQQ